MCLNHFDFVWIALYMLVVIHICSPNLTLELLSKEPDRFSSFTSVSVYEVAIMNLGLHGLTSSIANRDGGQEKSCDDCACC